MLSGINAVFNLTLHSMSVLSCQSHTCQSSWSINAVLSGIMFNLTLFYVIHAKCSWSINAVLSGIMFNLTLFYVIHAKGIVAGLLMQCYLVFYVMFNSHTILCQSYSSWSINAVHAKAMS